MVPFDAPSLAVLAVTDDLALVVFTEDFTDDLVVVVFVVAPAFVLVVFLDTFDVVDFDEALLGDVVPGLVTVLVPPVFVGDALGGIVRPVLRDCEVN